MNDYNKKCRHVWGSIPHIASIPFQKIIHFGRVFYHKRTISEENYFT